MLLFFALVVFVGVVLFLLLLDHESELGAISVYLFLLFFIELLFLS